MKAAEGKVFKYGDNVDTDVIIPARYLNSSRSKGTGNSTVWKISIADFVKKVHAGQISLWQARTLDAAHPESMHRSPSRQSGVILCDRRDLCANLLPQCHQYRTSDH